MSRHHYLSVVLPIADTEDLENEKVQQAIRDFQEEGGETYLDTDGAPRFWMTFDGEAGDTAASGLIQHMHTVAQAAESGAEVEVYVEDQHAAGEAVDDADRFVGPSAEARARVAIVSHLGTLCTTLEGIGSKVPENVKQELFEQIWEAWPSRDEPSAGPASN